MTASPTNWHTVAFGPIAVDRDSLVLLLQHLFSRSPGRVELTHLTRGDRELVGAVAERCGYMVRGTTMRRTATVSGAESFDEYLGRRDRRRLRRLDDARRHLEAQGCLDLVVHSRSETLSSAVEEFLALEQRGWVVESGLPILADNTTAVFYRDIAAWAAEVGVLSVAFLQLDGRSIAGTLCIEDHRSTFALRSAFEPATGLGPVLILQLDLIRLSLAQGRDYELTGEALPYRMNWADETRDLTRIALRPGKRR
ncbi:MAG: hypothetical protein ABS81_11455 [Pseudonocardia sp. SCN 72-86]|nr:MAG: hypothetical protein ABS81_11455 [Pseudonocardia sp. SCN 72-86]